MSSGATTIHSLPDASLELIEVSLATPVASQRFMGISEICRTI